MASASETTVRPTLLWCLPCLRSDLQHFKPEEGRMFEISCAIKPHLTNTRCITCVPKHGRICETTAEAMKGNAYDLVRSLNWLSRLFEDGQTLEARVAAADLQRDLVRSFLHVESMHRDAHKIGGRRLFRNQVGAEEYKRLVAERQPALAPIPDESTSPDLQTRFFAENMLRLWMGDVGYFEWRNALRIFDDGRKKLVRGNILTTSFYIDDRPMSRIIPRTAVIFKDAPANLNQESFWMKNYKLRCYVLLHIFSSSQLSAAIPVGNTPLVGLWTLPHQELRRSCNTIIIIKVTKYLSSHSSRKPDELKPVQQRHNIPQFQ
ncbi:hypothetical protein N7451_000999 [Penicillium sp. IBT 35674x]|nr:hypothetical protein N7451_000999 [Penicillium sp. IBT 35674x]